MKTPIIDWIDIKKYKPSDREKVLVSDGYIVTAATFRYLKNGGYYLDACKHGGCKHGYEWDFDESSITHCAKLPDAPIV